MLQSRDLQFLPYVSGELHSELFLNLLDDVVQTSIGLYDEQFALLDLGLNLITDFALHDRDIRLCVVFALVSQDVNTD